jgi:hypothetical protein
MEESAARFSDLDSASRRDLLSSWQNVKESVAGGGGGHSSGKFLAGPFNQSAHQRLQALANGWWRLGLNFSRMD